MTNIRVTRVAVLAAVAASMALIFAVTPAHAQRESVSVKASDDLGISLHRIGCDQLQVTTKFDAAAQTTASVAWTAQMTPVTYTGTSASGTGWQHTFSGLALPKDPFPALVNLDVPGGPHYAEFMVPNCVKGVALPSLFQGVASNYAFETDVDELLQMTTRPVIRGSGRVGETLTATVGRWVPRIQFGGTQWYVVEKGRAVPIKGKRLPSWAPDASFRGKRVLFNLQAGHVGFRFSNAFTEPVLIR